MENRSILKKVTGKIKQIRNYQFSFLLNGYGLIIYRPCKSHHDLNAVFNFILCYIDVCEEKSLFDQLSIIHIRDIAAKNEHNKDGIRYCMEKQLGAEP